MTMGLRPLDLVRWLEVDDDRAAQLAMKRELLEMTPDVVTAVRPGGREASEELLHEVTRSLRVDHGIEVEPPSGLHPVVDAALMVQEDLCVLTRSDAWRLEAASVSFPSRWSLTAKIGRTLDEIHIPVPLYGETLSGPTNSVFDRMTSDRSFWRLNWTLLDDPALHQPSSPRRSPPGGLREWYFRVERQTLRRLPDTGAVIFTIRTYVANAFELSENYEGFSHALLVSLETAPDSVKEYKGWLGLADQLRDSLA